MRRTSSIAALLALGADVASGQQWWSRRRTAPTPSPPAPQGDLETQLQQQVDAVVSQFAGQYPGLALSVAYTDADHHILVSSGKASEREVTIEDTFLYGSGTKPFTAAGILRLIDAGKVKASDKVSDVIDPYLKRHGHGTLASFFGTAVSKATVLELIRMGAGIRDFEDNYAFDQWVLAPGNSSKFWDYPYDAMTWAASAENSQGKGPLYCDPGTCTAYSSTSYEVAGLVLAAVLAPETPWYSFDLATALFDDRSEYPSLSFPPTSNSNSAKISDILTTPGQTYAATWEKTTIYDQNPSILGWTCGNLVGSPSDVSKFFYNLLDANAKSPLLTPSSRSEMTNFQTLTEGWNAGRLKYGAGLMNLEYGRNYRSHSSGISVQGHEGDTYGFVSSQGYAPSLKGAYSVASNVDQPSPMETMVSRLLQTLSKAIDSGDAVLESERGIQETPVLV